MATNKIEERVSYLMARICHAHRNNVNSRLAELNLHVGQEMFLLRLGQKDGISQSELADSLCVQQATITRMLDRIANAGLVERRKDPGDQRVSRVYLTEQGRALLEPIAQIWHDTEAEMFEGFSLEERVLLRRFLMQLYSNLSK